MFFTESISVFILLLGPGSPNAHCSAPPNKHMLKNSGNFMDAFKGMHTITYFLGGKGLTSAIFCGNPVTTTATFS